MTCLAFDIDGTIYDCGDIISEAFQKTIEITIETSSKEIIMPSKEAIISTLGIPTDLIFQTLFPYLTVEEQLQMTELCTDILADMIRNGGGLIYDGVHSTLKKFHNEGYKILAASNGKLKYISAILESNNLMKYFTQPITVLNSAIQSKSDIVKHYINSDCHNELIIMIGDRESDKLAAEDNKIPFIGCMFGHAEEELESVNWIAKDFNDLYDIVKIIEKEASK